MWEELKRPTTLIGIAVGVIGIIAGILTSLYFYISAQARATIVLQVDQIQVFDKNRGGPMPLTLRDKSGHAIDDNVFVASATVWNAGNAELKNDDIRQPFRLTITGGLAKVIEITPTYYSRSNVDQFSVDNGEIHWKHFDPGEGFKVRLIYASPSMRHITLDGYAVGTNIVNTEQQQQLHIQWRDRLTKVLALISISGFVIIGIIKLIWQHNERFAWLSPIVIITASVSVAVANALIVFGSDVIGVVKPPF